MLALIDEEPCAQSAASLVLRLEAEGAQWSTMLGERRNSESTDFADSGISKPPRLTNVLPGIPPHGHLLTGIRRRAEVVRNRNAKPGYLPMDDNRAQRETAPLERSNVHTFGTAKTLFNRQSAIGSR